MKTAIKIKISPDAATVRILDGQSRICNWLYNNLLEKANTLREAYKETQDPEIVKTLYTQRGLRNLVPGLKKQHNFLKSVHSSPLKNVALRLSDCITTYQKSHKGRRRGKRTGWPRFRAWGQKWFSLLYDEPNKGFSIQDNTLNISLGVDENGKRLRLVIPMTDSAVLHKKSIRNLRIIKEAEYFYVVFAVESEKPLSKPIERVVALDPNHKNLAYGFDDAAVAFEIEAPTWLKSYDKRVDELKSKRDKCKKKSVLLDLLDSNGNPTGKRRWCPSRRWNKLNKTIETALRKRREQTKAFLYTLANELYRCYDLVSIGNYSPHGNGENKAMRRAMNNRSLIGRLKEVLSWVAIKSGKHYHEFDERGTTRTCHACGYVNEDGIAPNIRAWYCLDCGFYHIRDENAAINGLRKVLWNDSKKIGEKSSLVPGSGPVQTTERWAWRVLPSGVVTALRGQNSDYCAQRQEIKSGAW